MADSEVDVLARVLNALSELGDEPARRIVRWLIDKYGMTDAAAAHASHNGPGLGVPRLPGVPVAPAGVPAPDDFAALFTETAPTTEKDRALIAMYWFQVVRGENDVDGFALNRELKNLGHGVGNITKALSYSIEADPQLVIQTRKSGGSRQARKKYRITRAGITTVETMLAKARATATTA